jgi:hypothetical protein
MNETDMKILVQKLVENNKDISKALEALKSQLQDIQIDFVNIKSSTCSTNE